MPRKKRIIRPNLIYNTWSQCCGQENLLESKAIKHLFLQTVKETAEKMKFEILTYQVMDNHFHLIIKTVHGGKTISDIMKDIKYRFSRKFNKAFNRKGTLWTGRYECQVLENALSAHEHLLWLIWYIAYNPCRKKTVSDPRDYPFGSINLFLTESIQIDIDVHFHEAYINLGKTASQRQMHFAAIEKEKKDLLLMSAERR